MLALLNIYPVKLRRKAKLFNWEAVASCAAGFNGGVSWAGLFSFFFHGLLGAVDADPGGAVLDQVYPDQAMRILGKGCSVGSCLTTDHWRPASDIRQLISI